MNKQSSETTNKKITFVVNEFNSLFDFRRELVESLLEKGYSIYIIGPKSGNYTYFQNIGCNVVFVDLERRGKSIFKDYIYRKQIKKEIKSINPFIVLSYSMKPNINSGLACKKLGIPYISTITGLGKAFEINPVVTIAVKFLLRKALSKSLCVFAQNSSIYDFLIANKIGHKNIKIINGSGVNTDYFEYKELQKKNGLNILYAGRIMGAKGIDELLFAIRNIAVNHSDVTFSMVGKIEEDKYKDILSETENEIGNFHYLGISDGIKGIIYNYDLVVTATHSEGMSNVLQESLSCGRPIIAPNIPGCKEICDDGVNGYLFEVKNKEQLQKAIEKYIDLPFEKKKEMSSNGRLIVEQRFNRKNVVKAYIEEIEKSKCL